MKKEIKDPKATLRMVSDNVPDIIYSLNPKGEFISISPSVKSAMGYQPSELIGTSVFQIIHPGDREKVKETFLKSVKTGDTKVKIIRFRMNTKSGKAKHFEIRRKIVLKDGHMIRNDGIARDITHAVELEEKLKQYHQDMAKANLDLWDIGRVYLEGETSDTWHTAIGGGLWFSFLERTYTFSAALASSQEKLSFYIRAGFFF